MFFLYSNDNVLAFLITIFTFPEHKQTNGRKGQKTYFKCILEIRVIAIPVKCAYMYIPLYHCREDAIQILKMFYKYMLGGTFIVKRHS